MKHIGMALAAVFCICAPALSQAADTGSEQLPGLHVIDPKTPEGLQTLLRHNGDALHLVAAHRGGARQGFPENCIATFADTLRHTAAIMEVDPRYSKDGVIVLHHDPTLERTTDSKGRVADHTWAELKTLRLKDPKGNLTPYAMPTLDEALEWARGKTILVLDQKDVPVEARVRKIEEHQAEAYAMLIVYSFAGAKRCHEMNECIMMEVMIPSREQLEAFDKTGVPWSNIVAFVGHSPPQDAGLCAAIHAKGASCMAGTSRNLDRRLLDGQVTTVDALGDEYHALMDKGVDLIETDIPREVGRLLYGTRAVPPSRATFFPWFQP